MSKNIIEPKATINLGFSYNPEHKDILSTCYEDSLDDAVASILEFNTVEADFEERLRQTRIKSLHLVRNITVEIPDTEVPEGSYSKAIAKYPEVQRKLLWDYRRLTIRITLLATLTNNDVNKKRFSFRLAGVIRGILDAIQRGNVERITLSQAVHAASRFVSVKQYVTKSGEIRSVTPWIVDELALQFISELAELEYLDLKINLSAGEKIHTVNIADSSLAKLNKTEMIYQSRVRRFLAMGTILTTEPVIGAKLITQSSWWYQTPVMVADQLEFLEAMYSIKFGFTDDAEDCVEEMWKLHLKTPILEDWAQNRVTEYKAQIAASKANGGHYISGKMDSALRYYFGAEIGHFQTSSYMRSIVTLVDVPNPVKYDFRNNVVQMYAVLSGIKSLATFVGLTDDSEQAGDLRTILAERLNSSLDVTTFNRDNVKPLFMIWAYNAGRKRLMEGVHKVEVDFFSGHATYSIVTPGLSAIAGLPVNRDDDVWEAWDSALNELVPGIAAIKMVFRKLMKANPLMETEWTLPDGVIAQYASAETVSEHLNWVSSANKLHTHTHYRKELSKGEKNSGVLPRVIHSFDAYVMRQLVIRGKREGIIIVPNHDSFIFDESKKARVNELVNDIFIELLESKAMSEVLKEINVAGANLTLKNGDNKNVTSEMFGDKLTAEDIIAGTPMAAEEM